MKNLLKTACLLLIFAILLFSCKKSHSPTVNNNTINNVDSVVIDHNLIGRWQWIDTYLDYPPGPTNPGTPQNTGDSEVLTFNVNRTYNKTLNNVLTDSGIFFTGHGSYTDPFHTYLYDSIGYYHEDTLVNVDFYKVSNDTLIFNGFYAGLVGAAVKYYVKF